MQKRHLSHLEYVLLGAFALVALFPLAAAQGGAVADVLPFDPFEVIAVLPL